ncbi:GEVED domain-containing protein, partial [Fluviicola sp.]|uniref:GEVED domain-containing protein n=1 Tax=Fluviicola sp. TaxID=1917219 RepID=UPI002831A651
MGNTKISCHLAKRFALAILLMTVTYTQSLAQTFVQITSGTAGTPQYNAGPIYRSSAASAYNASRYSYLYTQSELAAVGIFNGDIITDLGWIKNNNTTSAVGAKFRIYIKNSSAATYSNTTETWTNLNAGTTLVYENLNYSVPATQNPNYIMFTLSAPFIYTGGSLEISTEWDINGVSGNPSTGTFDWLWSTVPNRIYGSGNTTLAPIANLSSTTNSISDITSRRPFLQIGYTPGTTCSGTPTAGTANATVANACAGVSFNVSLTGATVGGGVTYQWQSSPAGANTWANISGATGAFYTVTNQTAASDYHCIVTCTNGGSADTSNVVSVGQNTPSQCYCTPTGGTSSTLYYLNNITTSSGITNLSYSASSYSAYVNAYNTNSFTQLPGQPVNVSMSVSSGTNYFHAWIDWNQNGSFNDPGELVINQVSYSSSPFNSVINIPAGQAPGNYHVRFAATELSPALTSCGPAPYGNYVDTKLIIGSPQPCTVSPTSVSVTPPGPVSACTNSFVQFIANTPDPLINGYSYQWYQDGSPITGAVNSSYTYVASASANFYVEVSCPADPGNIISSNTVMLDATAPCPSPCTPTAGSSSTTYYLNNITSTGGLADFAYTASSYSAYQDKYGILSAVQLPGLDLNISIGSSSTASNYYYCWVDWNHDGDFNDAGETIFATTSYQVAPYNSGIIHIPAAQTAGSYRVRFALSESGIITSCGPAPYGSYVDMELVVMAQTDCAMPFGIHGTAHPDSLLMGWNWMQSVYPIQSFNIQYGMPGGNSTIISANGINLADTIADANLMGSGVYQVYVQAVCSTSTGTDTSAYMGPYTIVMPITNDLVCAQQAIQLG